jgi:beta-galactosidase/beta-glucuronidase
MLKKVLFAIADTIPCVSIAQANDYVEWQDQNAYRNGQLDIHTLVVPYANGNQSNIRSHAFANSHYYLNLNGSWKFNWSEDPTKRPEGFYKTDFDASSWKDIKVPGNWQCQGYGTKVYVNENYEYDSKFYNFKKNPPHVPVQNNEVGSYRRTFTIPASWKDRRVVLCAEGVSSFFYVWVNGQYLGCNQDSKTAAEWDIPSDFAFCCNGLVNSDRTPHPHLSEVSKVYQYIKSSLVSANQFIGVNVKNWYDFTDLNKFTMHWSVVSPEGKTLASGDRKISLAPQQASDVNLGKFSLPEGVDEAYLNINWTIDQGYSLLQNGQQVAYDQFVLGSREVPVYAAGKLKGKNNVYTSGNISFTVDAETGNITSLTANGAEQLATPLSLSLYRPITENDNRDKGNKWKEEGLPDFTQKATSIKAKNNVVNVNTTLTNKAGKSLGTAQYKYSVSDNNTLNVECNFVPDTATVKSLARVGLTYRATKENAWSISYLGRGEVETYADRKSCGLIGVYNTNPEKNFHYYINFK